MKINMKNWFRITSNEADIAISTRIRFARNLVGVPFPSRMSIDQKNAVRKKILSEIMTSNSYISDEFQFIDLESLSEYELISLVEKHLVSPEFIYDIKGKALVIDKDYKTSIMINEEDHIRIQVISESIAEAYEKAERIDNLLSERLNIAFDEKLGYLTQCPTNLGTAMRASIMLHLPSLTDIAAMGRITSNLSKLGIIVRGTYGEGTEILGCMYQISNQITLGLSEAESIENLSCITYQLIEEEKRAETEMARNLTIQDKISRALGIMKTAKILCNKEFIELSSLVKFGISRALIAGITCKEINLLTESVQPAIIITENNLEGIRESDIYRAKLVREKLISASI